MERKIIEHQLNSAPDIMNNFSIEYDKYMLKISTDKTFIYISYKQVNGIIVRRGELTFYTKKGYFNFEDNGTIQAGI